MLEPNDDEIAIHKIREVNTHLDGAVAAVKAVCPYLDRETLAYAAGMLDELERIRQRAGVLSAYARRNGGAAGAGDSCGDHPGE